MKLLTKLASCTVVTAALALAAAPPCRAQLAPPVGPTAERERSDADRDLEQRIANMRWLAAIAEKSRGRRKPDPKLALAQLQEDFTRLQIVNKDLVLTSARSEELDLKFVAKSASEIHRRAERLMANLALPEVPAEERAQPGAISDSAQLKKSITAMGWLIYGFAKNPMFKEVDVIETESAAKARRDLEAIIELSGRVKEGSEQLSKAARKPR